MNPRRIAAIVRKDIFEAVRNYHILLLIATPIILSLLFSNLFSESRAKTMMPRIGIIAPADHPLLLQLKPEKLGLRLVFFQTRNELEAKIAESDVSLGLILPTGTATGTELARKPRLTMVYPAETPEYLVERFQRTLEDELRKFFSLAPPPLPLDIAWEPIGGNATTNRSFGGDMFPMLVLMAMGMMGLLGLPLSMAEERERKTLDALFLTPVTTGELIFGKCLFSFSMQLFTIFAMVALNSRWEGHQVWFWIVAALGSMLFLLVGLFVASFARTQGTVNAVGSSLFLCFQMVPTLSPSSEVLRLVAHLVPSTYILRGLKKALFLDLSKVDITSDILTLLFIIVVCYSLLHLSFRRLEADT
ncbi:MAG TPA: ABC transporter permease [Candidatus Ozemobacteraceae bacterium]|nr:ABC transporter permease [Candidatus Ozemobacteraceae bacterium]